MRTTATKTIKPPPSHPPKSALRRNYEDLQLKYIRLVHILCQIKEAVGHDGPVNDIPGIVRELKIAGVAQIEPAKAERAGSGPAPGDQFHWIEGDKPECHGWYWAIGSITNGPKMHYYNGQWLTEEEYLVCYDILAYLPIETPIGPHGPVTYHSTRLSPWIKGDKPKENGYYWVAYNYRGSYHMVIQQRLGGEWYPAGSRPLVKVLAYIPISSPKQYGED